MNAGGATTVSSTSNGGPAFQLEFYHRLDHLAAGSTPDTLRRGYVHLGWAEPAEDDGAVGYWGQKASPGFEKLLPKL